jgi:predicted alpha/beta-fold hydrolase
VHRERLELDDGDFIDVDWLNHDTDHAAPTLLILHGLEGSIQSSYIQGLLGRYKHTNWRVGVMHFRGCSGVPNRLARSYHSGDTQDLDYVIRHIERSSSLFVAGFSLGGNVLLKYLGEQGASAAVDAAVAVSVPFDLDNAAHRLDDGFSKIYRRHLMRDLFDKTRYKRAKFPDHDWPDDHTLDSCRSFVDFDHRVTAPLHGFSSGKEYYQRCSSGQFLINIKIPTLIIHAKDDPFMTPDAIPSAELISDSVEFELSDAGGHMGFLYEKKLFRLSRYLDDRIPAWLMNQYQNGKRVG